MPLCHTRHHKYQSRAWHMTKIKTSRVALLSPLTSPIKVAPTHQQLTYPQTIWMDIFHNLICSCKIN